VSGQLRSAIAKRQLAPGKHGPHVFDARVERVEQIPYFSRLAQRKVDVGQRRQGHAS
jgi:hypothetical protein